MLIGLVKWFDIEKGFGVIITFDQGEFFIHKSNFIVCPPKLASGIAVSFRAKKEHNKDRQSAVNCRMVSGRGDFSLILQLLNQNDTVSFERSNSIARPLTGRFGSRRTAIQHRETYSIKIKAMDQLISSTPVDTIRYFVMDYFDKELPKKHFVAYCEFIERSIKKQYIAADYDPLLQDIYHHFHSSLTPDMLFGCWKVKKFRFIHYADDIDHEIPENVLMNHKAHISSEDLGRIAAYSYGPLFCEIIARETLVRLEQAPNEEILAALPLLEYISAAHRPLLQEKLSELLVTGYKKQIQDHVQQYPVINSESIFQGYQAFKSNIIGISDREKELLDAEIDALIISLAADNFKTTLWLSGLIPDIEYSLVEAAYLSANSDKRIAILCRVPSEDQAKLIIALADHAGYENTFSFMASYFKNIYQDPQFSLRKELSDETFLSTKPEAHLIKILLDLITRQAPPMTQLQLFLKAGFAIFPRRQHF